MTNSLNFKTRGSQFITNVPHGSRWFRRLYRECKSISPHIRFKRIRFGFYRIYYRQAYIHEVYSEMPLKGYDLIDEDPRFESQKYAEEYEADGELQRKIKNYVEGYVDSIQKIKIRINNFMNDKEAYETQRKAYSQMRIL